MPDPVRPKGGAPDDHWEVEREALVSERDDLVRKLGASSARTAQLEARLTQLEQEGAGVQERLRALVSERDALRRQLASLDQDREEAERDLQMRLEQARAGGTEVVELQERARELAARLGEAEARAQALEAERAELVAQHTALEGRGAIPGEAQADSGELARAKATTAQLELRLKDFGEQLAFDQRRIAAHSAERQRLSDQAARAQRRVSELEVELGAQQDQFAKLQKARAELEQRTERQRERLQDLEARSARRRERIEDLEARLAKRNEQLAELRAELEALRDEHHTLAEEAEGLVRARRDLAARVEAQDRELAASDQEHQEALVALQASERRADELDQLRARVADELNQQRTQARELGQRLKTTEGELAAVRTHAEELRGTIGTLRERAEAAEESLSNAVEERRLLVAHLARVQNELLERDERLDKLIASRWYQLASAAWRVRRRPVLLLAGLAPVLALAGAFVALALLSLAWPWFAGLGLLSLITAGLIGRRILRGLRRRPPRRRRAVAIPLADGQKIAPLPQKPTLQEPASERAPASSGAAVPASAPQQGAAGGPVAPGPKLVPAPPGGAVLDREREAFLIGARQVDPHELRVAGILDEMSRACFGPECDLFCEFTMENWEEKLAAWPPHLLLVESAWSGNSGGWQYGVASYQHPHYAGLPRLRALLEWCRAREIPTVFWNKEDPVHFDRFKEAAALFDHILTTDSNCIPAYEALSGEQVRSISALPFAAQPRLHNPIAAIEQRRLEPVFAGTYYRNRHLDRRKSLEMILDAARPFGLIIYDRTYGTESEEFGFPERFLPHIAGRLPYDQVIDVYKRHRLFVNVNSVADSPTMFSRRVFELLACGTAVVSTESVGIEQMFSGLVPVVHSLEEATAAIEKLLYDDQHFADITRRARRLVLGEHTYRRRLAQIAGAAGFDVSIDAGQEVAVVALADSADALPPVVEAILNQSIAPQEVIIGSTAPDEIAAELERLRDRLGEDRVRGCTQDAAQQADGRYRELGRLAAAPWIAPMGDQAMYTPDHIRDLVACIDFADAQVIGTARLQDGAAPVQHRYVDALQPLTALVARDVMATHGWADDPAATRRMFDRGVRLYAGDGSALTREQEPSPSSGNGASRRRLRRR